MKLGLELGEDDDVRRYRRKRTRYRVACLACAGALAIAVAWVVVAVTQGVESLHDDDFVTLISITFGLLALPVPVTAVKTARWNKRLRQRLYDLGDGKIVHPPDSWVPPGPGVTSHDGVDLSVEIPQLRTVAWRAAGIAALWMAVMAGGFIGLGQLSQSSQRLLDTGTKATGTVYGSSLSNGGSIEVYYPVGSIMVTAHIELLSKRSFAQGAKVEVTYDPAEPTRVRTADDPNDSRFVGMFFMPLGAALLGFPFAAVAATGWFRRYRAVRRTGWHPASVKAVKFGGALPTIYVRYTAGGGGEITMRSVASSHGAMRLAQDKPQQAWVGGEDRAMVVLFPRDDGKRPYAVPARSDGLREVTLRHRWKARRKRR
jgi:hypothetical protein